MSRSRIVFFVLSLTVVTTLVGGHWFAEAAQGEGEDSLYKYLSTFTEVFSLIRRAYVEQTDVDALMAGALDGTTDALDPLSIYIPADQVEPFLAARRVGSRRSGLTLLKERGIAYAATVVPGSPAAAGGVQPGDVVAKIGGESTRVLPLWQIQERLAADPGTVVDLELLRRGEEISAHLTLGDYEVPPPSLSPLGAEGSGAAALRLGGLGTGSEEAVRELLAQARQQGIERLLVDLRDTATGEPAVAYAVGGMFADGELGQLKKRDLTLETYRGGDRPLWRGRLVVLVDRGTLGAAEVLAAILRQKEGAILVGETTFGHAGRMDLAELSNGGRLLYTDAFYTGPDGVLLQEGLEPDEEVDTVAQFFSEDKKPLAELIYRRGVEVLLADDAETRQPEAA